MTCNNPGIQAAALVVDIREGAGLKHFPKVFTAIRKIVTARLIFLEADDDAIVRRFSETRRPHPLGTDKSIIPSIRANASSLASIRAMADLIINTSRFTVHQLREFIGERFSGKRDQTSIRSTSPVSGIAMACRPIATWCSTCGFCRILTTFRDSKT